MCARQATCEGLRTTCKTQFSPSVISIPWIQLRLSDLVAETFDL